MFVLINLPRCAGCDCANWWWPEDSGKVSGKSATHTKTNNSELRSLDAHKTLQVIVRCRVNWLDSLCLRSSPFRSALQRQVDSERRKSAVQKLMIWDIVFFFGNCTGEAHAPRERSAGWCWIWEGTVCWVNKIAVHTGGLRAWSPWWETWEALNLYKLSLLVILVRASGLQSLQCLKRPVPALVESSPTASVPGVGGSILSRRLRGCLLVQLSVLERWALSSNQSWG